MFEIGQWAPWLTEILAIVLVMTAKWLGWPFKEAENEPSRQPIEQNEEGAQEQKAGGVESYPLTDLTSHLDCSDGSRYEKLRRQARPVGRRFSDAV